MPATLSYPGVYIEELAALAVKDATLSSSIASNPMATNSALTAAQPELATYQAAISAMLESAAALLKP